MPHNIVEVDAFTTPIVVPDGADSRSNAAEVVQAIAQALGNRTNRLNIHSAFKDASNTFTQPNVFDALVGVLANVETSATAAGSGAFVVRTTPSDDAHAGNKYKYVLSFNVGSYYVNCFSGIVGGGSDGQFLITINADWDVPTQTWHKDSTGDAAYALILDVPSGAAKFCIQHGTGTWSAWAVNDAAIDAGVAVLQTLLVGVDAGVGGNLTIGGTITGSSTLHVTGVATADAGYISGQDYILPAGNHIKYATLASVFRRARLAAGIADETVNGAIVFDGAKWHSTATAYVLSVPIAEFANQTEIDAVWLRYEASGANGTVELVRVLVNDWLVTPSGATPTVTSLATATLTTAGAGVKTAIATLGTPEIVDHSQYDYFIRVTGLAGATHNVWAAGLTIKPFSPGID